LFLALRAAAAPHETERATAATLATADGGGRPSARLVLVKDVDELGFRFHTNYESRKGRELTANPFAALCFHWPHNEQQVRIEGAVERLGAAESDAYFASRPRGSQLGAWVSRQSEPLRSRFALLRDVVALEARHLGRSIARPPHWGGYLLRPDRIEFWQGRKSRLHDRFSYRLTPQGWTMTRLAP
jgi:pyridoxamine 5'-phosphate oxidase